MRSASRATRRPLVHDEILPSRDADPWFAARLAAHELTRPATPASTRTSPDRPEARPLRPPRQRHRAAPRPALTGLAASPHHFNDR